MGRKRFVIRKIRTGRAKILGRWYYPSEIHLEYDGRLDEMRYAFSLYYDTEGNLEDFVGLWGTERAFRNPDEDWPGPECFDGYFNWYWWHTKDKVVEEIARIRHLLSSPYILEGERAKYEQAILSHELTLKKITSLEGP
jgi:hypothetical protein